MLFSQACCLVKTSVAKTQLGLQFLEGYLKLYRRGFSKTASSASLSSCTVVLERTQEQGTGQGMSLGNSPSHERKFNRTVHIASHVRSLHTSSTDLGIRVLNFYIVTGCICLYHADVRVRKEYCKPRVNIREKSQRDAL